MKRNSTSAPDVIATLDSDNSGVDGSPSANDGVCNYLMGGAGVDMLLQYNSNNGRADLTRLN